jgi:hypothetical protein
MKNKIYKIFQIKEELSYSCILVLTSAKKKNKIENGKLKICGINYWGKVLEENVIVRDNGNNYDGFRIFRLFSFCVWILNFARFF